MIYVGIDDTDVKGSPGTNQLARWMIGQLRPEYECVVAIRHQLLFDPRIPYTSKNSTASLLFVPPTEGLVQDFAERARHLMRQWFVSGSDPGLCVTQEVPVELTHFGRRCQKQVVRQEQARQLAARCSIHLEGIGGSEDGVIGAMAAVGLLAEGNDGRVVNVGGWPDDLSGLQDAALLHRRGVAEIRCLGSGQLIRSGNVDVGRHLRPSYRGGRIVLFVEPILPDASCTTAWRAVRMS